MEGGAKGKVSVTGGTGFIGSCLVKNLLDNGYSVNTTVRSDPEKKRDYSFLTNLPGASEKLQIYHADLDHPDSFAPAIEGCIGVFHLANPNHEENEPIETVIFLDESCWSDIDVINDQVPFLRSYPLSKTLTERAALEFSQQYGLEVVTVLPTYVVGPFICPNLPSTVRLALALPFGIEAFYGFLSNINVVHVDDVARAHIFLFENPNANGRYVCSCHKMTMEELVKLFSARYPEFQIPSLESLKDVKIYVKSSNHMFSSKKLLDTGFEYKHGVDEIFDGAIQSCKEKGYL